MSVNKIDINDIDGLLKEYSNYKVKDISKYCSRLELVGIVPGAFNDNYYYIDRNDIEKVIYRLSR